jgi:hypothetical protein
MRVTIMGEALSVWQSAEWWPKQGALVQAGPAGHDHEITVTLWDFDHTNQIPEIVELAVRQALPETWKIDNRGTRLEIHPSGRFAGGFCADDVAAVERALVELRVGQVELR